MYNNPNFRNLKTESTMNNTRITYSRNNVTAAAQYIINNNPHPLVYNRTVQQMISDFEEIMWNMVKNGNIYSGTAGYIILHADTYECDGCTVYSFDIYVTPNFIENDGQDEYITIERV